MIRTDDFRGCRPILHRRTPPCRSRSEKWCKPPSPEEGRPFPQNRRSPQQTTRERKRPPCRPLYPNPPCPSSPRLADGSLDLNGTARDLLEGLLNAIMGEQASELAEAGGVGRKAVGR